MFLIFETAIGIWYLMIRRRWYRFNAQEAKRRGKNVDVIFPVTILQTTLFIADLRWDWFFLLLISLAPCNLFIKAKTLLQFHLNIEHNFSLERLLKSLIAKYLPDLPSVPKYSFFNWLIGF